MELQLTKEEKIARLKSKATTALGVPLLLLSLFMIAGKIYDAITGNCPDCHFSIYEILITTILGYAFLIAKDTLITAMIGLIIPRKK
jgi:hypothetical protein